MRFKPVKFFSLLEIMVAIAILGILSYLIIPSVFDILRESRNTRCMADFRKIKEAFHAYRANYQFQPGISPWPEKMEDLYQLLQPGSEDNKGVFDPWGRAYYLGWLSSPPTAVSPDFVKNDSRYLPQKDFSLIPPGIDIDIYVVSVSEDADPPYLKVGEMM